ACSGSKARASRAQTRRRATNMSPSRSCCRNGPIPSSRNSPGAGKPRRIPAGTWRLEMIPLEQFLARARLEHRLLQAWIAAGWLVPPQTEPEPMFSDVDLARAQLIRDLREDLGVNDEGISVVLHLVDQMHGLRRGMRELVDEMRAGERRR